MKVWVWNMAAGFGFDPARHEAAWRYLRDANPDIALLQEAVTPSWTRKHWPYVVAARKYPGSGPGDSVAWGCAIVSRLGPFENFVPGDDYTCLRALWGCVVVGVLADADPLWLATIHSNAYPFTAEKLEGLPVTGLRRCDDKGIWEIEVITAELERLLAGRRFIVGGDLNSALLLDEVYGEDSSARLFSNLAEAGFVDLRLRHVRQEQRTYFKPGMHPYQLDHVFADAETAQLTRSWRVLPEAAETKALSDHAPIEIVIEL